MWISFQAPLRFFTLGLCYHMPMVLKLFGFETPFHTCKLLRISKSFCKCEFITMKVTLEIKTKKMSK